MLEWLKRHAWKACVPPKGIASSNLALSAKMPSASAQEAFLANSIPNNIPKTQRWPIKKSLAGRHLSAKDEGYVGFDKEGAEMLLNHLSLWSG